jgi:uncharacterized membrane protein (UPF0127 family)
MTLGAACCQRPAQEDFSRAASSTAEPAEPSHTPPPSDGAVATGRSARLSGDRCVRLTAEGPPPAVPPGSAADCPTDPEASVSAARLPTVSVIFEDVRGVSVNAELVHSPHDTMRGLMYRKSLGEDQGMLFDLGVREDHRFWMHNTCIPLDLIFVDFDGLVVGIVENAPTLNDEARGVGCPSRWVLEVNAGWARRHGVKSGQRIELPR